MIRLKNCQNLENIIWDTDFLMWNGWLIYKMSDDDTMTSMFSLKEFTGCVDHIHASVVIKDK